MRIFTKIYDAVLHWSKHPKASYYLGGLSFAESSFFPIPPDVMLMPMTLTQPQKAWFFAGLTTIASVLGGILGYFIGLLAFEWIAFLVTGNGAWAHSYQATQEWFEKMGFWAIFPIIFICSF